MATQNLNSILSATATADFSNTPNIFLVRTAGGIAAGSGATVPLAGVLLNKPLLGEAAACATVGEALVVSGGALAVGDKVTSDASGQAIVTTTLGNYFGGVVVTPAAGIGEYVTIQLLNGTVA